MNLAEVTWLDAREAFARCDVAIVPVGAVEVYGPHLPLGSDGIVANAIARCLGDMTGAIVLPLVPISCSQGLSDFPGTLWVPTGVLKSYLEALCASAVRQGIRRFLFINGHLTNVAVIDEIARDLLQQGVHCAQIDWWRFAYRVSADITESGQHANGHASEVGTSVLLALAGNLVALEAMRSELPKPGLPSRYPEVIQYRRYGEYTESGVVGDPGTASVEKGKVIVERCLERLQQFLAEWQAETPR